MDQGAALPDQPLGEMARLLALTSSALPVLQQAHLWQGGMPGSPFWAQVESEGRDGCFVACARKEALFTVSGVAEPVSMIRWIYRYKPSSISGSTWTREICALSSSLLPDSNENCIIGVIQRETQRTTKRSSSAAVAKSDSKRCKRISLPQQLLAYESWSLTLHFPSGTAPVEWVTKWTSYEQVDLWMLPPVDRIEKISKICSAFQSVAIFWNAEELQRIVTSQGAAFPLSMSAMRVPNLDNPRVMSVTKLLTRELESKLLSRPAIRVQLPKALMSARTTTESVHYTHWTGAEFYGPLNNGVPHGWGKSTFGSESALYAEHEGQYAHGLPNGPGLCRIKMHNELVLTYEGEFIAGGFGKHGKLSWPDGSTYEGDVLHKDWIYLSSRVTGQVYRVSAVLTMAQPHFERLPIGSPPPRMTYTVGSKAQTPTGLERLLTVIEESEGERVCNSTYSTAPSSPVDRLTETIEPLPLEESITALLDEAFGCV